ncbi:MAG: glycosyltransferase [Candidatus Anstonellales archaeon]
MRILQVNNYGYIRGGSDRYFIDIGNLLARYGEDVEYLTTENEKNIVKTRYLVKGIDTMHPALSDLLRFFYSQDARKKVKKLITDKKPDIAHLHIYYGQITSSILSVLKDANIPIVQTLHEYKLFCPVSTFIRNGLVCEKCAGKKYWNCIIYRCNRRNLLKSLIVALEAYVADFLGAKGLIDHFIAVSNFVRSKMIDQGIQASKISTVYNFVPDDMFCKNHNRIGSYFLYYGRIEHIKGIGTLIKAMKSIKGTNLYIAGHGEAEDDLKRYAAKLGIRNVKFMGFKIGEELKQLIDGSICTIVPSECNETFGLTVVESFARGKPVIVSNMGGLPEIVMDGIDGFIFQAGNVEELSEKLNWFAMNLKKAEDMGMMGYKKAREKFTSERHYEEIMKIYRKVLRDV